MKITKRFTMIFRSKANAAADKFEDPAQIMDYSYQKQLQALQDVRRGIADVATSRARLELQANDLHASMARLQGQAKQALSLNREDLARAALARRAGIGGQLEDIVAQRDALLAQETRLTVGLGQLQTRVEGFRTKAETIKASYSAAEAQSRISESLGGLGSEMAAVGDAMRRAEDHAARMQARSTALDELYSSGVLEDPSRPMQDPTERHLNQLMAEQQVELELARMKQERQITEG
ncbi:PspA/IM30 family protein [Arthrobacter sp. 35W]|uniref:PspA/IM30 family protein n=1 Tax=Arthrobacter sp. 35W TaxID=1132441 RepID=UPI0004253DBC|nr:PspA/IM30 family protein [Arthrobacter sp. 35W]